MLGREEDNNNICATSLKIAEYKYSRGGTEVAHKEMAGECQNIYDEIPTDRIRLSSSSISSHFKGLIGRSQTQFSSG